MVQTCFVFDISHNEHPSPQRLNPGSACLRRQSCGYVCVYRVVALFVPPDAHVCTAAAGGANTPSCLSDGLCPLSLSTQLHALPFHVSMQRMLCLFCKGRGGGRVLGKKRVSAIYEFATLLVPEHHGTTTICCPASQESSSSSSSMSSSSMQSAAFKRGTGVSSSCGAILHMPTSTHSALHLSTTPRCTAWPPIAE